MNGGPPNDDPMRADPLLLGRLTDRRELSRRYVWCPETPETQNMNRRSETLSRMPMPSMSATTLLPP